MSEYKTPEFLIQRGAVRGHKKILIPKQPNCLSDPFEINLSGKIPFCILVDDYEYSEKSPFSIIVQTSRSVAELRFKKHVKGSKDSLSIAGEDKSGDFTFTTFDMIIHPISVDGGDFKRAILDESGSYSIRGAIDLAVEVINKFIDSYILAWDLESLVLPKELSKRANKDWIPNLDKSRLSPWQGIVIYSYSDEVLFKQSHIDFRGTGWGIGTTLSEGALGFLQERSINTYTKTSKYYQRIANRHFSLNEYEAFCAMLATLLDKVIFERADQYLKRKGLSEEEIYLELHTQRKRRRGSRHQTISREDALAKLLGSKNFKNSREWKSLEEDLIDVRDELIHGEIEGIDIGKAKKMMSSFNDFTTYLDDNTIVVEAVANSV